MKLDRVFVGEVECGQITDRYAADHVLKVLRLKVGDEFAGYDGKKELVFKIVNVSAGCLEVEVVAEREIFQAACREIILAVALIKASRWEWLLEKAVEVGATAVQPVVAERSVVKWSGGAGKMDRWKKVMMSAVAQSAGRLPELLEPISSEIFFTSCDAGSRFIMSGEGEPLVKVVSSAGAGGIVLAVGPEGGWTDAECANAAGAGFIPAGLGNRILRTETAAITAVAITAALCQE